MQRERRIGALRGLLVEARLPVDTSTVKSAAHVIDDVIVAHAGIGIAGRWKVA